MDMNAAPPEYPGESHILLVDDDPITLEQMAVLLEDRGHFVTCSTTGIEAAMLIKEYPDLFDALLVNHSIPGMSGIKSSGSANSLSSNTPIFLHIDTKYFIKENRLSQIDITNIADRSFDIDELDSVLKRIINKKMGLYE